MLYLCALKIGENHINTKERTMKPIYPALALTIVLAAGLAAPTAYKAVYAAAADGGMIHSGHGWGGHRSFGPRWKRHFGGEHVEGRIAFLEAELGITDEQQGEWSALADVLRGAAIRMRELGEDLRTEREEAGEHDSISAVERLERWEGLAEEGLATFKRLRAAVTPLYAVMSQEQKQRADRLLSHRHKR